MQFDFENILLVVFIYYATQSLIFIFGLLKTIILNMKIYYLKFLLLLPQETKKIIFPIASTPFKIKLSKRIIRNHCHQ